jgi:hypothetical protein
LGVLFNLSHFVNNCAWVTNYNGKDQENKLDNPKSLSQSNDFIEDLSGVSLCDQGSHSNVGTRLNSSVNPDLLLSVPHVDNNSQIEHTDADNINSTEKIELNE